MSFSAFRSEQDSSLCYTIFLSLLLLLAPAAVEAQPVPEEAPDSVVNKAPNAYFPVLIVDRDQLLARSELSERFDEHLNAVRTRVQNEIDRRNKELSEEEQELTELRGQIAQGEFDDRVRAYENKLSSARRFAQSSSLELQKAQQSVSRRIDRILIPIMQKLVAEHRAHILLDRKDVVLFSETLDITEQVLALLNEATKDIDPVAILSNSGLTSFAVEE